MTYDLTVTVNAGAQSSQPVTVPVTLTNSGPLDGLGRVPWEGGPDYWRQFPNAARWADESFFPIAVWFGNFSSDAEVQWDKDHGINTYMGMWEGTPFDLFERNGVYWVGGKLNDGFRDDSAFWPGVLLDDEVDGRFTPAAGHAHLQTLADQWRGQGKFLYANYTQLVVGPDMPVSDQERYVNDFTDAVSLDMYWYTIPFCDWTPYRGDGYVVPTEQPVCRTASSYGRMMRSLMIRDQADGVLQPRWNFIENYNGLSGQDHVRYIAPGEIKGAAMSSLINEARGILWFNQSFTGPNWTNNVIRQAQYGGPDHFAADHIAAMGDINRLIHKLAPVLNTQSYVWDFGPGLDTMLKAKDGHVFIFAMTDGGTGPRTFTLPPGLSGQWTVYGESRTIDGTSGSFTDTFTNEYDYHIYRAAI